VTSLTGQTLVVLGGTAGVGLATARLAREHGADLTLTTRDPDRLLEAGRELNAKIAAFDVSDFDRLQRFFDALTGPIDHILLTGLGPCCASLRAFDVDEARRALDVHLILPVLVARNAVGRVRAGGTLLFVSGSGGRRVAPGPAMIGAITAAMPALTKNLALELAPIRVNLIAAGLVDMPFAGRVVDSADVAALALHLMTKTAVTGATFDVDGGQQLVEQ
jgi:NAD(P)-dependent dehydrogenase (short-subunit alcohol dehydrogenase family)